MGQWASQPPMAGGMTRQGAIVTTPGCNCHNNCYILLLFCFLDFIESQVLLQFSFNQYRNNAMIAKTIISKKFKTLPVLSENNYIYKL